MDDVNYAETTVTANGEECYVDAVKDPRLGRPTPWQARGNYKKNFILANGVTKEEAFKNWQEKALSGDITNTSSDRT